jgi:hypothetical protein
MYLVLSVFTSRPTSSLASVRASHRIIILYFKLLRSFCGDVKNAGEIENRIYTSNLIRVYICVFLKCVLCSFVYLEFTK